MKSLDILLNHEKILEDVRRLAAYSGKKITDAQGGSAYDVMHITKEEEDVLETFCTEAKATLMDVLKPFLDSDIDKQGHIRCLMPSNWDENLTGTVNDTVHEYMVSYVASKWYRIVNQGKEAAETADANIKMTELRRKLYWKRKPVLREEKSYETED